MTYGLMLLSGLAAALIVLGVYSMLADIFLRDQSRVGRRLDDEFRQGQRQLVRKSSLFKKLGATPATPVSGETLDQVEAPYLEQLVEQSGLDITVQRLMVLTLMCSLILGAILGAIRQSPAAMALGLALGGSAPYWYVARKRKQRLAALCAQLPDAFDLMSRVIRAGQSLPRALSAVSEEFDKPIAEEFSFCYEQMNLGLPPEAAFRDLVRRAGVLELKIFVLAVIVQQQTGGNLAELLDSLSKVVRERFRVQSRVRALTAEGRLSAGILMALPWMLFLLLLVLNADYTMVLFDYPVLLVGMLMAELLGGMWIYSIVNFEF